MPTAPVLPTVTPQSSPPSLPAPSREAGGQRARSLGVGIVAMAALVTVAVVAAGVGAWAVLRPPEEPGAVAIASAPAERPSAEGPAALPASSPAVSPSPESASTAPASTPSAESASAAAVSAATPSPESAAPTVASASPPSPESAAPTVASASTTSAGSATATASAPSAGSASTAPASTPSAAPAAPAPPWTVRFPFASTTPTDRLAPPAALLSCRAIHVAGYSDDRGSPAANAWISTERARAVRAALLRAGVSPDAITTEGRGAADPVSPNTTSAGRAANRRAVAHCTTTGSTHGTHEG